MEIKDIEALASLARIGLTDEEKKDLLKDAEEILTFVGKVQEVEVDMSAEERLGVPHNVMRDDTDPHETGVYTKALLEAAPNVEDGYLKVKKIL